MSPGPWQTALDGARPPWSQGNVQPNARSPFPRQRVTLSTGVHETLEDFKWLVKDVANWPTQMYKLVPLRPTMDGYHDAYGYMCRGVVLPGPTATPR